MRTVYPIILKKSEDFILVSVPDFQIDTQGVDYADALFMARDAISLVGITLEDDNKPIPSPSAPDSISLSEGEVLTLVDVDFVEYRRKNDNRTTRRNVSLPVWLDMLAKEANINVSQVLQAALKRELHIAP